MEFEYAYVLYFDRHYSISQYFCLVCFRSFGVNDICVDSLRRRYKYTANERRVCPPHFGTGMTLSFHNQTFMELSRIRT
jgi:hypothetical protein